MKVPRVALLLVLLCAVLLCDVTSAHNAWERPGCYNLGHTRTVKIPGCVMFQVTTNACRGYCVSYAYPSTSSTLQRNPSHVLTSRSDCCSIGETHDVNVSVHCMDGRRDLTFKSAKTCICSTCRHS